MSHERSCARSSAPQSEIGRLYDFLLASDPVRMAQYERDMEILAPRGVLYTQDTPTSSTSQQEGLGVIETMLSRLSRTTKSRTR
jgi:hypothetical protein